MSKKTVIFAIAFILFFVVGGVFAVILLSGSFSKKPLSCSNPNLEAKVILMEDDGYREQNPVVKRCTKVTFKNVGKEVHWPASNIHPTHGIYPQFDPKRGIEPQGEWSFVFEREGKWKYHDHLNVQIYGVITVEPLSDGEQENVSFSISDRDIFEDPKEWEATVEEIGIAGAYEKFKTVYKNKTNVHNALHVFSGLIYKKAGLEGIIFCDDSFAFGCFHGFFTAALAKEGIEAVGKLDQICVNKFGLKQPGCQHGIGHGLIEYLGHGNLEEALDICAGLSWKGKIYGCPSGVFMEYNMPFLIEEKSASQGLRKFDLNNKYFPCTLVKSSFAPSCYFELAQYLITVYKKDYKSLGNVCLGVESLNFRRYCFLGLGYYAPQAFSKDTNLVINACFQMPDESFVVMCRIAASLSTMSEGNRGKALELCQGLPREDLSLCNSTKYFIEKGVI